MQPNRTITVCMYLYRSKLAPAGLREKPFGSSRSPWPACSRRNRGFFYLVETVSHSTPKKTTSSFLVQRKPRLITYRSDLIHWIVQELQCIRLYAIHIYIIQYSGIGYGNPFRGGEVGQQRRSIGLGNGPVLAGAGGVQQGESRSGP